MRIVVLGNSGSWHGAELERAIVARGHECFCVDFERLTASEGHGDSVLRSDAIDLAGVDAVIVRTMPAGSLEQVVFRMDALARLEAAGVTVINCPKAMECAVDKYLTTSRLAAAGLLVPETIVCENAATALEAFEALGHDVVVKPLFGSEGRGIVRLTDRELAHRTFYALEQIRSVLYVQRFVEHGGCDLRILVLDGNILGAIRRQCHRDFRANVAQHGTASSHIPTDRERDVAVRAANVTGCRFAGVDLLYNTRGRLFVIEVNAAPGWRALQAATGCRVADRLIDAIAGAIEPDVSPDSG